MLFRRREELNLWERFKLWLWPRVSWRRSGLYLLKRVLRLSGTPYAIAMGAAVGASVSFTPFLGLHFILTFAIAWLLRANMIAGAIATSIGNPLTFPLIWAGTYQLGHFLLNREGRTMPARLEHDLVHKSWDQLWPILKPMTVGAVPIGFAVGLAVYLVVYKAVSAYRDSRSQRFAGRRVQATTPAE
jgi:uncharacterized protein (DUF2062 family)